MPEKLDKIKELMDIMDRLREECPWDRKQTTQSLRNMTIEECYELCDAIDNQDSENIKEELGDLLLHVLFYSKIAEEQEQFNIGDVAQCESEKLKYRHPHIFGSVEVNSAEDVVRNWDELKKREKGESRASILSGVPNSIPAILKAEKIQSKVAKVGFDWREPQDVWDKVFEEIAEVREAIELGDKRAVEEEFGDLMFSIVNACRLYGVSGESALEMCNKKFMNRFGLAEQLAVNIGVSMSQCSLEQKEQLWQEAKKLKK